MTTALEFMDPGESMTEREARDFIGYVRTQQDELPRRTVDAYQRRAWLALGYGSWAAMCDGEGLRLPREVTSELRAGGLSIRAIAAVTGVTHPTALADARAGGKEGKEDLPPGSTIGLDGKSYPAKQSEAEPDAPEDEPLWPDEDDQPESEPPSREPVPISRDRIHMPDRPAPVMLQLHTHTGEVVEYRRPQARATFNETTGEGISWAAWSWNPVTGCLHGCDYCYARAIAARWTDAYPAGFTPLFHHDPEHGYTRLDAPANTVIPQKYQDDAHESCGRGDCKICAYRRVFVCSMADLYGRWVPDEWIQKVHASMLASPAWQYILLTKFPARYVGLDLPPNAWVGTSVDEQKRVRIAEDAFRKVDGVGKKWLSLEPLNEQLEFSDLSMFDWVVIGAQTETRQPDGTVPARDPDPLWVLRITVRAKESGCRVHWKPNLRRVMGSLWFDEYPEG